MTPASPPSAADSGSAPEGGVPEDSESIAVADAVGGAGETSPRVLWWSVVGAVAAFAGLVYLLGPILSPFFFGAILAYIGSPIVVWGARHRVPRIIGALLVVAGMIAVIGGLILILVPMVQTETATIAQRLPELADRFNERFVPWAHDRFGIDLQFDAASLRALIADHMSGAQNFGFWVLGSLKIGGAALLGFFVNLLLTPVVMFYLLMDWDALIAWIGRLLPRRWSMSSEAFALEIDSVLAEYLRGQVTVMAILAIYYATALSLVGLQFAVPIGVLTGLLIFVPYLGFGIGLVLAMVVVMLQASAWQGVIGVLVVYGIGQLLESLALTPWLVGERIGLHPLAVIFALLAFGHLFGFTGVLLALPASAAILVALRHVSAAYTGSTVYRNES
jgi:predicted PurR-regulated permease PerM